MNKTALVFGSNGGIGSAVVASLLTQGYTVFPVTKDQVNFVHGESEKLISDILTLKDPDIVINCGGVFGDNSSDYYRMMDINVGSNWFIVKHYMNYTSKPIKIVLVGSSAYKAGKKSYMLYSLSKAALHNLWDGAKEFFSGRSITVNIIHPVRTRTKMVAPYDSNLDYLDPEEVAEAIVELAESDTSSCREISFKE
jgi:NAD(P)-dependent dehydrogenase (short-subunit alcohol dehydrogenase family)